ncbi:Spy/CpxP family protein refolding chaperone [Telmatospirillum siberiense]|nr:Spy/CpxP family protein refolding chaperone [Telmatospirillum siberiense]
MRLSPHISGLAGAAMLGVLMAAGPVMAQTDGAAAAAPAKQASGHHKEWAQRVEKRIDELHKTLQIKSDQEQLWSAVAQTMRDNATGMGDMIRDARSKEKETSAIEDLQNYQKIAQAHADGAARLVTAFQPLYESMSPEQKKVADTVFEHHKRGPMPKKHKD